MKLKVTKAITSHGTYYEAGSIVDMDPASAHSFIRLYGWEPVKKKAAAKSQTRRKAAQKKPVEAETDTGE